MSRIDNYRELKQKHPDAVILFSDGDFYESYEEDAEVTAEILGLVVTRREYKICGFPRHALDTYLPKLIRAGKRVAICDTI
jgi:DNA mismatch repair protein MutS